MKEDLNQKSLDFYLQNSSILIFAIGFLAIIVTNIFLKMINLNQYLHYIFLLLISSFTIVSISYTFSLLCVFIWQTKDMCENSFQIHIPTKNGYFIFLHLEICEVR